MNKKVIILGGGLSGLVAAEKLAGGFEVSIIEKSPFVGGLAASFEQDGEEIPCFNHHIIKSNKFTLEYLGKYGLALGSWKKIQMAIAVNSGIYNINKVPGLLKFDYLSFPGRLRLGLFGAYLIYFMNPRKIDEDLDAKSWLFRYAGREATEKVWSHLYARNKFNIELEEISAKQFAHRLHEKEGYDFFTFPLKGLQGLIEGLEKGVKSKGGRILTGATITNLDIKNKKITFKKNKKIHTEKFDILINTIPMPEFLKFAKGLPEEYVAKIRKVRYVPVVCLCFGTKEFLDSRHYWINFINERVHVLYQHSLLIDKYKSKVSWCIRYGGSEEDLNLSDAAIKEAYLGTLKRYFPGMQVEWCRIFREIYAEPIYDKNYRKYAPSNETPLDYLFNAGIQVTFPKIRNMDVAIESGIKIADIVMGKFR